MHALKLGCHAKTVNSGTGDAYYLLHDPVHEQLYIYFTADSLYFMILQTSLADPFHFSTSRLEVFENSSLI